MITPTEKDVGRRVVYVPSHVLRRGSSLAQYMHDQKDCEEGRITSITERFVFVNYGRGETSQATNREDLIWLEEKM